MKYHWLRFALFLPLCLAVAACSDTTPPKGGGDKEKAAGSYAKALNINQNYEPAKQAFARVGGKYGQTYQTFN